MSSGPADDFAARRITLLDALLRWLTPRSLLARSLLILIVPAMLVQAIATYVFFDRHWGTITARLSDAVAGEIVFTLAEIERTGIIPEAAGLSGAARDRQAPSLFVSAAESTDILYRFEAGETLASLSPRHWQSTLSRSLSAALARKTDHPHAIVLAEPERWVEVLVETQEGVLVALTPQRRLFSSTAFIFILWMIGSSLVLFAIAMVFMRNQIRPIRRLALAAERFGKGRPPPRLRREGASEVRQAAEAFHGMHERLQRQIAQRTEFLSGVSHDLRTPLTRMRLQTALLTDAEARHALVEDIEQMERMIEGYLTFVRGESGEAQAETDLAALVRQSVVLQARSGAEIDLHVEEPVALILRPDLTERAVGNLIGNAARYAGSVWVRVGRRGKYGEVVIDDDGPGIADEDRERVFRPFERLEKSRNPATGGIGLGLTVARDAARSQGGDVLLETAPQGGLRARFRVPL